MKPRVWLSPQAASILDSLPSPLKEKSREALESLAAGLVRGVALLDPLAPCLLYTVEPGLDVIYRRAEARMEVLTIRRQREGRPEGRSRKERIAGLILAAGCAEYLGRPLPLVPVGGRPLIAHLVQTFKAAEVKDLVVVLGYAAEEVLTQVELYGTEVVVNRRYHRRPASSLRYGLKLVGDAQAVLVSLADRPFVAASSVRKVLQHYRESRPPVVVPLYRQQPGHPVLFDSSVLPALRRVRYGGREVIRRYRAEVAPVPVEDEGVVRELGDHAASI